MENIQCIGYYGVLGDTLADKLATLLDWKTCFSFSGVSLWGLCRG